MEVTKIDEHKDGSATIHFDMTAEEQKGLVEIAILNILKERVENGQTAK